MSTHGSSSQSVRKRVRQLLKPRPKKHFQNLCKEIRNDLHDLMRPQDEPEKQFVSTDDLTRLWTHRDENSESRLDRFRKLLKALERDASIDECNLKLLSVLLWIHFPSDGWRDFAKTFPEINRQGWQDDFFPIKDQTRFHSLFENQIDYSAYASNFFRDQYLFSPARITEMESSDRLSEIKSLPQGTRLPFLQEEEIAHHGTHKVTRNEVAKGGLESATGDTTVWVAVKTFVPERRADFLNELRNLKAMKQVSPTHPNIQYCFSAIQIGSTGHLVFPAAECNVSQILHWQKHTFSKSFCDEIERSMRPSHLFWEAKELGSALEWLHGGFSEKDSSYWFRCYHLDFKPANILVFPSRPQQTHDIWTWKIADFGGSVVQIMDDAVLVARNESSGVTRGGHLPRGVYQAPEIDKEEYRIGTSADIWSFGCVLLELMAFAFGGPSAVRKLEELRNDDRRISRFYDETFHLRGDLSHWFSDLISGHAPLLSSWESIRDLLLQSNPEDRKTAYELKPTLHTLWKHFKSQRNELIFSSSSETSNVQQLTNTNSSVLNSIPIRLTGGHSEMKRSASKLLGKKPVKCRLSTTGNCAIIQVDSKPNYSAFRILPGWESPHEQGSWNALTEELHNIKVEKIATEGILCGAIVRDVDNHRTQLLLDDQTTRTLHSISPGTDLSISIDGHCIVHCERNLEIFLKGSDRVVELNLSGILKRACFSHDGKLIYTWSRKRNDDLVDYWQVIEVASDGCRFFKPCEHSFKLYLIAGESRDLLIPLRHSSDDESGERHRRPLFLTVDKYGNANIMLREGLEFVRLAIDGEYSGYVGGACSPNGRSVLLIHRSQGGSSSTRHSIHVLDLDPTKLRSADCNQPLELKYQVYSGSFLENYNIDTGFFIAARESAIYAHFAVWKKKDIILKRVLLTS